MPASRRFPAGTPAGIMLRRFRKDAGFTVSGLAEALGVTTQSVKNWEASRSRPVNIERVSRVLCLTESERVALESVVISERDAIRNR